jgi:hypothetical protein
MNLLDIALIGLTCLVIMTVICLGLHRREFLPLAIFTVNDVVLVASPFYPAKSATIIVACIVCVAATVLAFSWHYNRVRYQHTDLLLMAGTCLTITGCTNLAVDHWGMTLWSAATGSTFCMLGVFTMALGLASTLVHCKREAPTAFRK